jgi:acetyl-CoA carboxylase biotin carboxyl carrier protein
MDYKDIKKLMDDMGQSKLSEVEIEFPDGTKVSLKKNEETKIVSEIPQTAVSTPGQAETASKQEEKKLEGNVVKSPMVGTFYSKSSPTAESFVKIGSKVKKGDTLCIIEAMKLMNEIESEFDGEVVDILVHDEEAVDYGKELFIIK